MNQDASGEAGKQAYANMEDAPDHGPVYSWYVVAVLLVMMVFSYIDRQIIVLLIDPIRHDLGISDTQISLLTGFAFALFFSICGIPLGWAADRYSRRMLIFVSVIFWGLSTAFCGLARSFVQLFIGRMAVGVGEATLFPASHSIVADVFPKKKLTIALAVMGMGSPLGMGISYLIAGFFASWVTHTGTVTLPFLGEVRSWQVAFLAVGLPGPLIALLMFTIKEPHRSGSLKATDTSLRSMGLGKFIHDHWKFFACHGIGFGFFSMGAFATFTWAPVCLMRVFGWTGSQVGSVFGLTVAMGISLALLTGSTIVSYFYNRGMKDAHVRLYTYAGLIGTPIALLAYMSGSAWVFLAGLFVMFVIVNSYASSGFAAMQLIAPNEFRARLTAILMLSSTLIGSGLGPLIVALFTDYVFHDDMMVGWSLGISLAIIYPIAALLFWNAARHMRTMLS